MRGYVFVCGVGDGSRVCVYCVCVSCECGMFVTCEFGQLNFSSFQDNPDLRRNKYDVKLT